MGIVPEYERLVTPHLEDLRKYCNYLTKSKWDGEDLYQTTLLKSLVFFLHTEPYMDVKPFLIRVARNLWIDDCRKRQRRRLAVSEYSKGYYTDSDYVEVRSVIEWLAERFPRRNIDIWLLFNYFGYAMQEIAHEMNCSISAVKSILFRTREMLRNRQEPNEKRKIIHLDVERWSRAIMLDKPQGILSEG
ncbi:RNA polymerase sigma factor [Cohnella lupini]|uniref:RNA polymerase sigma-70 factor (ECF subfamily) n=1 Tax=Cohnella lupini TaxID=1294267 RepID=A0A3D9IEX1_9BACL|nr:RNA polymerase sigma factor [Cohnella lupini]RED60235.1 RNA polymerase sigma-70 factor (ECF subfamily) [Cohnella lupini]